MARGLKAWCIVPIALSVLILLCGGRESKAADQKGSRPASQPAPTAASQSPPRAGSSPAVQTTPQPTSEDLKNQPVQAGLFIQYLNKYGYTNYRMKSGNDEQVITFQVNDQRTSQAVSYAIVYLPKTQLFRIEAFDLADVPSDKGKLISFYQKITELNSKRTVGKFCLDAEKKKVRYIYYRTVFGGLCYADFKTTLGIIEFILMNDLKQIKELKS